MQGAPIPIASFTANNGNVVEFYDWGSGVLISETGPAYVSPSFRPNRGAAVDVVQVWEELAPGLPVPQGLIELRDRLNRLQPPHAGRESRAAQRVEVGGEEGEAPGVAGKEEAETLAPVGCSNGCCDYEWLSTLPECQPGADYSWFLYNYGSTWANLDDIMFYEGLVCSASGTSTYRVNIAGKGGTWSVPEGYYMWYYWRAAVAPWCGTFCGEDLRSSVNTPTSQHLHTYCGFIFYD